MAHAREYHCELDAPEDRLGQTEARMILGARMLVKLQSAISLLTCGCLVCVAASPASIGFVVTTGHAEVDGAVIHGDSTLFQGTVIRAGDTASDLVFPGGSNLLLQPGATVKVFREYGVLEHGAAVQRGSHPLVADGLKVSSLSPQGAALVDVQDEFHLRVAAQNGVAEVCNPAGTLVARLEPGKALSFTVQVPQQNQTTPSSPQNAAPNTSSQTPTPTGEQLTIHGVLRKDHPGHYGHFLLTDTISNVTYELQGSDLDDLVGASVEVTGSTFDRAAAEGASKVMAVSDIHQMPAGEIHGETPGAPAGNTAPAAPPTPSGDTVPPGAGPEVGATPGATAPPEPAAPAQPPPLPVHSDTTKILVIVAVAAGAVVGVALGLGGGKSSTVSPE